MSTNDVPGANAANGDQLRMGCWAEHADGSRILVESTENDKVVYSMFDMAKKPILEYRDAMPTEVFKRQFSRNGDITEAHGLWTWHDKTPFNFDEVIPLGAQARNMRFASADDHLTAADRIARSLRLRAQEVDERRRAQLQGRQIRRERQTPPREPRQSREGRILGLIEDVRDDFNERLDRIRDELESADEQ